MNFNEVKYLKIYYQDSFGTLHVTKSTLKNYNEMNFVAIFKYDNQTIFKVSQDMRIDFVCLDGLYKSNAELIETRKEDIYQILIFKTPQKYEYQQTREYFRVKASILCKCFYNDENSIESQMGKTFDISANGVAISFDKKINPNSIFKMLICLSDKEISIPLKYIRHEIIDDGSIYSYAYENLLEEERDIISKWCIKKQLAERSKLMY